MQNVQNYWTNDEELHVISQVAGPAHTLLTKIVKHTGNKSQN